MDVKIIASGSKGNCAVIDGVIAIDVGADPGYPVRHTFLTHHHTDHTKKIDKVCYSHLYCLHETAEQLRKKNPYLSPTEVTPGQSIVICDGVGKGMYNVTPFSVNHDCPCVGYDIIRRGHRSGEHEKRILFATDFSSIVDEAYIVDGLRARMYDAVYIECNNTLGYNDFIDIYFPEADEQVPKDDFHRRRSYQNHCNAGYLIGLFKKAGYSERNRFPNPVTLLHKSSFYYLSNVDYIVELDKVANIVNKFG